MKLYKIIAAASLIAINIEAKAQLYPLGTTYFQNEYISNPAMAGIQNGLHFNGSLRKQWSNIPGSPLNQSVTVDYRMKERVGLGLNLYNDEAGLLKRTSAAASYAYHLPMGENSGLHMGLSLGLSFDRVMNEQINGDQNDQSVSRFNQRETYVDGDFGMAYTNNKLTIQASVPNLKQVLKKDDLNSVDRHTFFSAISYRWNLGQDLSGASIIPKVVYRGIKGHDNLFDAGANFLFVNDRISLMGMYHSTENATFGLGMNYHEFSILGMYTSATGALRGYTSGNFEIGVKYSILR